MGFVIDYIEFLNDIIHPFSKASSANKCKNIVVDESTQKAANITSSRIINKNSSINSQNIDSKNNITVDCGPLSRDPFYLQFKEVKYDSSGKPIPNTGCPMFGCCYNVLQSSRIKLKQINKNITEQTENIVNDVSQTIKKNVDLTLGPNSKCSKFVNKSINETKNISMNSINNILDITKTQDVNANQDITIKSEYPLLCHNKCDKQPSAGEISQAINIDVISKNITTNITKNIQNNVIEQISKADTKMTEVNQEKLIVFSIITIVIFLVLYLMAFVTVELFCSPAGNFIPPFIIPRICDALENVKFIEDKYKFVMAFIILYLMVEIFLKTIICLIIDGASMKCIPFVNYFL
jgi:hypothetical protein